MFHYLLQILIFQLLFLLVYDILHKKDTFFNWNRLYLLLVPFLALILPFMEIDLLTSSSAETYISTIERTIVASTENIIPNVNPIAHEAEISFQSINWWMVIYAFGILISLLHLILKFHKLHILRNISNISSAFNKRIVILPNSSHAFSFWNTIFLGDSLTEEEKKNIISHELVHVDHKHTIDQICIEILKVLLWWNPLIYIYQARITLLHEYIADAVTINKVNQRNYIEQLLNAAFQTEKITFINQFFNQSLIKKRILMLQKSQSKSIAKFKYLLLIPIITGILTYTSCKNESDTSNKTTEKITSTNPSVQNSITKTGCLGEKGTYHYKLDNYLKITTGSNSEVLVFLINVKSSEIIRKAHIPRNQEHYIKNIPEGVFRTDVIYGDQYVEEEKGGFCTGFFKKERLSEKGEDILDFNTVVTEKGTNVPSYSLALDLLPENSKNPVDYSQDTNTTVSGNNEEKQTNDEKRMKIAQRKGITGQIDKGKAEPYCANQNASRYDYTLDNYLKMNTGDNAEVIIDIVSIKTKQSVRTIHLPKNTEYYIRNIPEGIYKLKIVYGDGYEENTKNKECVLSFKNQLFIEDGQDKLDFTVITTKEGKNVPSYSMNVDMLGDHQHPTE